MKSEYLLQKEDELYPMLKISWKRGPDLPQGFQDSDAGFIGDFLVNVGGFCQGREEMAQPKRYPRGFLKKVWAMDISADKRSWIELPEFPAGERQGLSCTEVNGALYCWGGFNYTEPFNYTDGYRLFHRDGQWVWEELPSLPFPLSFAGISSIGSKIFISGGGDYDSEHFYTWSDRNRKVERLGAQLMVFDTNNSSSGWRRLGEIPGTPRLLHAMAAIDKSIYMIGGVSGKDNDQPNMEGSDEALVSVVDNWRYDCIGKGWTRLPDTPISTGSFPDNKIVFKNRYILLIGGYQYEACVNNNGPFEKKYGTARRFYEKGAYFSDMFVYDVVKNIFGRADSLPLNNLAPTAVLRGDEIYLLGGETGGSVIEGVSYGHHPDLCLIGKIKEIM